MPSTPPVHLRPYNDATDAALVYSSWINQVRSLPPLACTDPRLHRPVVATLLARGSCLVACNPADHAHVYGYAVTELPDVLHFVYVRNTFRRFGIGSLLCASLLPSFKQQTTFCTHNTRALPHLRRPWRLEFNPYKVMK